MFARRFACLLSLICSTAAGTAGAQAAPWSGSAALAESVVDVGSAFVPIGPLRVADTRSPSCECDPQSVDGGEIRRIDLGDLDAVPGDADAVALSITVEGRHRAGFLTVYTDGTERPDVSNLNWRAGELRTNSAVVALGTAAGAARRLAIFVSTDAQVMIDVAGAFVPADLHPHAGSGRFVPIAPMRALDSRPATLPATGTARVPLPLGIPADATAIAANFTVIPTREPGFLSARAAGAPPPEVSQATFSAPGFASASPAIVPISAEGFDLSVSTEAEVIVDITGWFTGPGETTHPPEDGLLHLVGPYRVFDSRSSSTTIYDDGAIDVALDAAFDVGDRIGAIVGNITLVGPTNHTHLSVYPAGARAPATSTVNAAAHTDVAAATLLAPSTDGIRLLSRRETGALVDVFGYFTGTPLPNQGIPAANLPPSQRFASIDALVHRLAQGSHAASITVRRNGAVLYRRAEGRTVSGSPATPDTPMMQASVSKIVTALTIARLYQEGLVDIDAPVPWALLDLTPHQDWNDVSLRELLEHTSGMPSVESRWFVASSGTCRLVLDDLIVNPPLATRAARSYSNGNYCLLGEVIEAVTGERYDRAAYQYVFEPAGIGGPHLSRDGLRPDDAPHARAMNTRNLVGAAGQWLVSSDDVALMLDGVEDADMDVLGGTAFNTTWASPYGGFGHTGTLSGAKACAWVIGDLVVSSVIAGETVSSGAALCRMVMPEIVAAAASV